MAKFELIFLDQILEEDKTIQVFFNPKENTNYREHSIRICLKDLDSETETYFDMDKSTAIKFAKTLRTEINKMTEREVKDAN